MIRRLRKKFVFVAMIAVAAVLLTIIGIVNIVNYVYLNESADEKLALLAKNGGSFFNEGNNEFGPPGAGGPDEPDASILPPDFFVGRRWMNEETPYEVRYFSVTYENGELTEVNVRRIASVDEQEAAAYGAEVRGNKSDKGYADDYRYLKTTIDGKEVYLFLDCSGDLTTYRDFVLYSFLISAAGLVVVFILVMFFSKMVVKPVADSYEKQKQFITDASHELKTPLTIISANTEILEMDAGENEWTESIRHQVSRLTEMTNNLVYLSRMEEENPRLNSTDFSLTDLVRDTAAPYEALAMTSGKTLSVFAPDEVRFFGDEKAIKQALTMLFDNAMKYSSAHGAVSVSCRATAKEKVIVVENDVDDMEIGKHDELFERFARSDKSRNSKTGGSGIGMAVAQAVVKAHGGRISAECPDRKTFVVTIIL